MDYFVKNNQGKYPNLYRRFKDAFCIRGIFLDYSKYYHVQFTVRIPKYVRRMSAEAERIGPWTLTKTVIYGLKNGISIQYPAIYVTADLESNGFVYDIINQTIRFRKELISAFKIIKPIRYNTRIGLSETEIIYSLRSRKKFNTNITKIDMDDLIDTL